MLIFKHLLSENEKVLISKRRAYFISKMDGVSKEQHLKCEPPKTKPVSRFLNYFSITKNSDLQKQKKIAISNLTMCHFGDEKHYLKNMNNFRLFIGLSFILPEEVTTCS